MKHIFIFALKILLTVIPAYFVYKNIVSSPDFGLDDLVSLWTDIKVFPIFLAIFCMLISHFTGCMQWQVLLKKQEISLSFTHLLKLYFVGLFFNNFMPGNIGGDVKKIYDIRMQGGQDSIGAGLTATFFDRLFGLFFLTVLALGVGFLFFIHDNSQRVFLIPSLWTFFGFCFLFACLFSKRLGKLLAKGAKIIFPEKIYLRLLRMQNRFQYFRTWNLWGKIFLLSTITQILRVLVHYFCGIAIGIDIAVSWYFFYIPLVAIVSALPISIGGFGPRELLAQSLFAKIGVSNLNSVFVQLIAYFVGLLLSFIGVVFFFTDTGKIQTKHKEH